MRRKTVTVKQIQDLDRIAIGRYGVRSLVLMENAGRLVATEILRRIKKLRSPKVCILCGLGNNAGDGFVAARHLVNAGIKVKTYLIGRASRLKQDAQVNYRILRRLNVPVRDIHKTDARLRKDIAQAPIVIDAIFGVGLNRAITEPFYGIIETANRHANRIVAVDIPSGLDGTTGEIYGICIKADVTVTFSFVKRGFLKAQGPAHTGKVIVADIGIPKKIVNGKW